MITRPTTPVACVLAVAVGTAAILNAQGRRGGAPPGAARAAAAGTVEHITVHGKALEGNLEGDSPDREVTIYLPASYTGDQMRRYPVVYLLHGYGLRDDAFTSATPCSTPSASSASRGSTPPAVRLADLGASADKLGAAQGFSDLIVVTPNAFTLHKGSMYSSSPTIGDWETFVARDLVEYIDGHYRTIATRMSRGLAGHSMGGYGALRIGMKRPDVFSSLYVMSACCLAPNNDPRPEDLAAAEAIKTRAQAEEAGRGCGFGASLNLALAAAWSPNPKNSPLYLDLPMKAGKVQAEVIAKWTANAPLTMLEHHTTELQKYYSVAIEIGTKDTLIASNRQLHDAMMRLRIAHSYEEYDGDHTNKIGERIERNLLPFFSKNLVSPANPTSPAVQN